MFDADAGANNTFACATKRGVYIFNWDGKELDKKRGLFGSNPRTSMITMTYDEENNCFLSGTSKGTVYTWQGNSCTRYKKLHEGTVKGLQWANGFLLSSGSRDNLVKVSKNYEVVQTFEIPSYAKSLDYFNGKILVGTNCGKMLTIDYESKEQKIIM